jgi:hypothetical protein
MSENKVNKPSAAKQKVLKIKFLLSPTRKFLLAYNVGEIGDFEEKQANELVKAKYAEFVK